MKINDISENSPLCSGFVMTFIPSSRWIECPNTRKSIGNGFPLKKYVGAVVRKLSQLIKVVEIDHFENKMQYRNMYRKYNDHLKTRLYRDNTQKCSKITSRARI